MIFWKAVILTKNIEFDMLFTSVRGHIMGYEFGPQNKIWSLNTSRDLYQANIYHNLNPDSKIIKDNLINIARTYNINTLILWLDCDREGENIAFEVIEIIQSLNIRNLEILRASFSAITNCFFCHFFVDLPIARECPGVFYMPRNLGNQIGVLNPLVKIPNT